MPAIDDVFEELYESEYYNTHGPEYSLIRVDNGVEYYSDQFRLLCPELGLSFSAGYAEREEGNAFDIIVESDINSDECTAIYSNLSMEELIAHEAEKQEIDENSVMCSLIIPDN